MIFIHCKLTQKWLFFIIHINKQIINEAQINISIPNYLQKYLITNQKFCFFFKTRSRAPPRSYTRKNSLPLQHALKPWYEITSQQGEQAKPRQRRISRALCVVEKHTYTQTLYGSIAPLVNLEKWNPSLVFCSPSSSTLSAQICDSELRFPSIFVFSPVPRRTVGEAGTINERARAQPLYESS